tara:strand:+ start:3266 stop:4444 length:1179 start_codon:yes stop_codon:yes gene_type:complete
MTVITSSSTVPSSPYSETTNSINYKISTTSDNPADTIRTIRIKTDAGDLVDYVTSGAFEIQSKIVPYVVEGIPIPSGAIATQYNVTSNGLSGMLETQMSLPATIGGVKVNSGTGFAYSATSREDAQNDAKEFGSSSIPFKDVAIPSGTPNINYSTTNQNYNLFYNEGTAVYTNWNDERKSDFGFISGSATVTTATKATVPDGYYAQWGWNGDGTPQNFPQKLLNCGFSVKVVNGIITERQQFGTCYKIVLNQISNHFSSGFAQSKTNTNVIGFGFSEIPPLSDLADIRGSLATQSDCGDLLLGVSSFYHTGAGREPDVGDKVKINRKSNYDGGVSSFGVFAKDFGTGSPKYLAATLLEDKGDRQGVMTLFTIVGFIVIETATATVVTKYECS